MEAWAGSASAKRRNGLHDMPIGSLPLSLSVSLYLPCGGRRRRRVFLPEERERGGGGAGGEGETVRRDGKIYEREGKERAGRLWGREAVEEEKRET